MLCRLRALGLHIVEKCREADLLLSESVEKAGKKVGLTAVGDIRAVPQDDLLKADAAEVFLGLHAAGKTSGKVKNDSAELCFNRGISGY